MEDLKLNDRYNILIEFVHAHLDFQRAELESVLSLHDIVIGKDCKEIPLPNQDSEYKHRRPFLLLSFDYKYANSKFELDESKVLGEDVFGLSMVNIDRPTIASIFSRVTLIRSAMELFGAGSSFDTCTDNIRDLTNGSAGKEIMAKCMEESSSWKITIHTLGTKYAREEQDAMRSKFSFLDFPGEVKMKSPTNEFLVIREIELDEKGTPLYPRFPTKNVLHKENDARPPLGVYFGRILGGRRDWRGQNRLGKFNLKRRSYLGPTSMDAELSLIMTNLGRVQKGSFCFDPFVGTGSILLTCGLRGAYCSGTDIDIRVLRGRGTDENILTNFQQFNLGRPELVRSDNSIYERHYLTKRPMYDAIITDPPYGIRAGARKSGSKLDKPRPVKEEDRHDHIAQTKVYAVSDVMADLLDVSARNLVMGGRLVYVIPSMTDFDVETDLPNHACFRLVHVCYQPLQSNLGRRTVTMEKVGEYDFSKRSEYLSQVWINGPESANKCASIREKLIELAKLKPGYEEKARHRKQKRIETREAKKKAKIEKR
eukprot:CAMPEP_0194084864 /NCGR_PEP_ID=MMETSP0149-20130528/15096_1 /TAXON_ID=122233 /ORGANISM="Chaetoceros debilis, Strain MM31A-1" /LENGTH=539 /DNA_ID=CAMNT_0038767621 /DNA_START=114 /DNA_END=1730 /DNA_ORIENTATION=-